MAVEMQDRWTEIRKLHVDWKDAYRILGGVVLVGIGVVIGASWFANPQADGYTTNLYTEFISIGVTVFILDFLNRRRDDRRRVEDLKAQLLRQVRSPENSVAKHAIHEMRERGWLGGKDGLLRKSDLKFANLAKVDFWRTNFEGADLMGAILDGARLTNSNMKKASFVYSSLVSADLGYSNLEDANLLGSNLTNANLILANLSGAILCNANLEGADLTSANLKAVDLREANLQGVSLVQNLRGILISAHFNSKTILPDAPMENEQDTLPADSYWTPDTDMTRYTDPEHPDFWHPEWAKAQGDEG